VCFTPAAFSAASNGGQPVGNRTAITEAHDAQAVIAAGLGAQEQRCGDEVLERLGLVERLEQRPCLVLVARVATRRAMTLG
jgi:hypothetical protein